MAEYPIGMVLTFGNKEYVVMKIQPEGIRLRGTKNNPLGERFEIVVDEKVGIGEGAVKHQLPQMQ